MMIKTMLLLIKKIVLLFLVNNIIFWYQNADLLKILVFIFFDKTYLQKPHFVTIKYIK